MAEPLYFQWQNEALCKTIYPMREPKLRDFLVYYLEVDLWKQYKDKDISTLKADVDAYAKAQEAAAITAYKSYKSLRDYFFVADVRSYYAKFKPINEAELTEINNFHAMFIQSCPKDIRGEKSFVEGMDQFWTNHRNMHRDAVKSKRRRVENMDPTHPKKAVETQELAVMENITLPMAEQELDQLRAFLKTYDKIEQRKLAWYKLSKGDPNFKPSEAEFLVQYKPETPVTVRDIVWWKVEEYKAALESKNQYQLLEEIYQRFKKEPKRFPHWLQYMVVHFSGMRYASAHNSWADPKDLLVRLNAADVEKKAKALDDAAVEKLCAEKIAAYEKGQGNVPKLARATEKQWKDLAAMHMLSVKATGPKTRRNGITALLVEEAKYDEFSLSTEEALKKLEGMKAKFPAWAWKEIVKLTPLRVNHVTDPNWEKLTPEEEAARNAQDAMEIRTVMDAWENYDPSAWRDEHGRSHELIVSRAVCNETAEHCQHIRGILPPGGLTPKPKWYATHEAEKKLPGAFYTKPTSEKDYVQGASIFWLRFVDKEPNAWQVAKDVKTKSGMGILPTTSAGKGEKKKKDDGKSAIAPWKYVGGEVVTRERTITDPQTKAKTNQKQWLRWIHEATVAEVAETADGMTVITYETALPDGDKGTSAVGTFKMPLSWHLDDGPEDTYNRSFVGFVPEGQVPMEHLKTMLDWNRILRKKVS
jgi:hypothetical protein